MKPQLTESPNLTNASPARRLLQRSIFRPKPAQYGRHLACAMRRRGRTASAFSTSTLLASQPPALPAEARGIADVQRQAAPPVGGREPLRLWVFSDLHLEMQGNNWEPIHRPPHDVIVAAGNIHAPMFRALDWLHERFPGERVVYVAGNHEHYTFPADDHRLDLEATIEAARERAARLGVDLLMDNTVVIDGARFVGATLWTDYRLGTWGLEDAYRTAEKAMDDYRRIHRLSSTRSSRRMRAEDLHALHSRSRVYIEGVLACHHDGPTVVVTHHAPHVRSLADPTDALNHVYASDLSGLIEQHNPTAWIHGHARVQSDYLIGRTRVVANPFGYPRETSLGEFDASFVVEV